MTKTLKVRTVYPDNYNPNLPPPIPKILTRDDSKERAEIEKRFERLRENMKYSAKK